jgi:hypothetical protein
MSELSSNAHNRTEDTTSHHGEEVEVIEGTVKFNGLPMNTVLVEGKHRVRKFNVSYLDAGVCPVSVVIDELPSVVTSWDPLKSDKSLPRMPVGSDGVRTETMTASTASTSSEVETGDVRVGAKRRKVKAVSKQRTGTDDIQRGFDYIKVHATGKRLGSFKQALEFAEADPVVEEYIRSGGGAIGGFNPTDHCFMLSCGDVQMAHLKMYDLPIKMGPVYDELEDPEAGREALCAAVDWVQDMLELDHKLPELEDLSVDDVTFDPTKSAGAYYRLQGFKARGEVADLAREEARHVLAMLLSGGTACHRPTRIGGRGKPVGMSIQAAIDAGLKKGRAIHMTDTRDGFILGLTEQPLNNAWKDKRYPISVGRGWFKGDCTDFVRRCAWAEVIKCYDAEKFDSSLMPYVIHIAVTICRMQFENGLDTRYDGYWLFVEESLLHSFVYRDDGVLFEKWIGTSSGHNHNSLLQSIVTLILGAFNAFYVNRDKPNVYVRGHFFIEGLGDDNLYAEAKGLRHESLEVAAMRIWRVFGVSWMGNKSFETDTVCETHVDDESWDESAMYGSAQYLGKYFRKYPVTIDDSGIRYSVIPYRPLVETVVRLLYPEKVARNIRGDIGTDIYNDARGGRWAGHMLDGCGNPKTRAWLFGLRDFCIERGYECANEVSRKMKARWRRMGVDVDVDDIDWDEFRFQDWLALVCIDKDGRLALLEQEGRR